jgi:hypothetical protein
MRKPEPRIRSEMRCKNIRHPDSRPASVVPRHGAEPEAVRAVRCDDSCRPFAGSTRTPRRPHAVAERGSRIGCVVGRCTEAAWLYHSITMQTSLRCIPIRGTRGPAAGGRGRSREAEGDRDIVAPSLTAPQPRPLLPLPRSFAARSAVRSPSCSRHSGTKWRCTPAAPDAAARGRMESALPSCTRLRGAMRSCTRASRRRVQQSVAR